MKIAYITSSKIPTVYDAQAQRCTSIIKLLSNATVDVVSNCKNIVHDAQKIADNMVHFYSYRGKNDSSKIDKIIAHIQMKHELATFLKSRKYDVIVFNDLSIGMMKAIKQFAYDAKLIYDAVEWYSPSENILGRFAPSYLSNDFVNRKFVTAGVAVISISKYFDRYFKKKEIPSFYMPVVLDKDLYSVSDCKDETIDIIYAGYMGKKDHITEFIKQFSRCDEMIKKRIKITLVGPHRSQFREITNFESIEFCPFMPHEQLLQLYQRMDFSILFRDETQRYAKAGFPTKLAESMMCGVPVICNLFSNIGDYLVDQQNAIIVSDKLEFGPIFEKLAALSKLDIERVKIQARKTAEEAFEYRNYKSGFSMFLNGVMEYEENREETDLL